ncbi:unnamed protein product [Spirodela intermedia]|uniref:Flavin-containing monooxygenase n=1 Tax=Spirodela intermedia TaxID=51605 RepID=A0A7I8JHD9_SPIIN|nr:unnamed protein product [Spirodela intermedia]CAA6669544.1 unnamed protein product [Spirodela intermedia]
MKTEVVIVGGGPSGLAVSACLSRFSIPNVILEREDCYGSLWKKRVYDRVKLHLAKEDDFVRYLDDYVSHFGLRPLFGKSVESATFDSDSRMWAVEEHLSRFLVVATGENAEGILPSFRGLDGFTGEILHSCHFKSAARFAGKRVLVVGSGNSGMEIAFDLCNYGAQTSISVRGPFHVLTKEMVYMGMVMLNHVSVQIVDALVLLMCRFQFGDLSGFGIIRPSEGPFSLKAKTGRSPVIDVGTLGKIKRGEIKVMKEVAGVAGGEVRFTDGETRSFDAIIFATGYRSTAADWLQDDGGLLNEEGFPKRAFPDHWKGGNGLFFAGLSRRGLAGVAMDAKKIAEDIKTYQGGPSRRST